MCKHQSERDKQNRGRVILCVKAGKDSDSADLFSSVFPAHLFC